MLDNFGRKISYLRISVTDRCNFRCVYCMPETGADFVPHDRIMSFEEILRVAQAAVKAGIRKVRLTGGEPLTRRDIVTLVNLLSRLDGVDVLAMTTNGALLDKFARRLKRGGLSRVNVSLDTLDPIRFAERSRGGDIKKVLNGLVAAKAAGLEPIKLNCVVKESAQEPDALAVAEFAKLHGFEARFIRQMNIEDGTYWVVQGGTGGDCSQCNRLRLTSDGLIKPCLFSDLAYDVRELGPEEAIRQAIGAKPKEGRHSRVNKFHSIGG